MIRKLKLLLNSIIGNIIIVPYYIFGTRLLKPLKHLDYNKLHPNIIVSLTSYGRRVNKTVYYTLVSILNQTHKPDRVILWLDDTWSRQKLPKRLKSLIDFGVEIKFYEDIRSYKKLIPTLLIAPDDIIITIDDDVFYKKHFISKLYQSYLKKPDHIHCTKGMVPLLIDSNSFAPYHTWNHPKINSNKTFLPIGEGGVLYPPHTLHNDVICKDLFTKLCPFADDVWFWVMAKINSTQHTLVTEGKCYYSFDALYQFFHKGSALTHSNKNQDKNDIQISKVLQEYPEFFHSLVL